MSDDARPSAPYPSPAPPPPPDHHRRRDDSAMRLVDGRPEPPGERLLRKRIEALERDVGHAPDPSSSPPDLGSGIRRTLAEIRLDLAEIKGLVGGGSRFVRWGATLFFGALIVLLAGAVWRLGDRVRIVDAGEARRDALSQSERGR